MNEKFVFITVEDKIIYADKSKANSIIGNELYSNSLYFLWIIF